MLLMDEYPSSEVTKSLFLKTLTSATLTQRAIFLNRRISTRGHLRAPECPQSLEAHGAGRRPFGNWGTAISASVQLFRQPVGEWVGVRAEARWRPAGGLGAGSGMLLDVRGEIGRVSMSVILVPFPKAETGAEPALKPVPAAN